MQLTPQHWDTRLLEERLRRVLARLSEPSTLSRVQQVILVLLTLWALSSLVRLVWSAFPTPGIQSPPAAPVNPAVVSRSTQQVVNVDLDAMLGLGLFSQPEATTEPDLVNAGSESGSREGIEAGARETRLDLKLQGILASTEDGLGSVIIEANRAQKQYAVGDKLPASGQVILAKVMPQQVVIDNNGTYELLRLFEDNELSKSIAKLSAASPATAPETKSIARPVTAPNSPARTLNPAVNNANLRQRAAEYRAQLYDNPEQLADLVTVAAVRDDNGLRGYRIGPGKDSQQFRAFGFEAGDVITAVNGYALSDPANTVRLYQLMRNATEATFDIDRNGVAVSVSVSLNE